MFAASSFKIPLCSSPQLHHLLPLHPEVLYCFGFYSNHQVFLYTVHTVHGVLKARVMKWFASPFSS